MTNRKVPRAFKKIARRDGVSVDTVRGEIEAALGAARENPALSAQFFWTQVSGKDEDIKTEDTIRQLAEMTKRP